MRILYIHNAPTRFVKIDLDLLQRHFFVTECYLKSPRFNPIDLMRQVRAHDIVLGWFASWHTLLPIITARRLGKPAVLIVGGYDTANLPQAGYGSQRGGLRRWIASTAMRQATHLLTNSHSAKRETMTNVEISAQKITVIYHGVPEIPPGDMNNRQPIALTVGGVWHENLLRKGLLPFVQTAAFLPELQFILVGKQFDDSIDSLQRLAPPNVQFTGFVTDKQLLQYFQDSSVYVQPSLHEGFGMSVAEAMLGGCIPVVNDAGSLPEVVGDTGYIVQTPQPEQIAKAIQLAHRVAFTTREQARGRILTEFSLDKREKKLHRFLLSLTNN